MNQTSWSDKPDPEYVPQQIDVINHFLYLFLIVKYKAIMNT